MRGWRILAIVIFCFGYAEGQETKLERFYLSNATLSETRAPIFIAQDLKLFEKFGLDLQLINIRGAALNIAALMAGEVQMAVANRTTAITAAARGVPIVIVATNGPTRYDLVSHTLSSSTELRNKTIGIFAFGMSDHNVLRRLLPKLGFHEKDLTLVPLGMTSSYDRLNMMLKGKADAVLASRSSVDRVGLRGVKLNVLAETEELGVEAASADFFTTRELLRTKRTQMKAVFRALGEAVRIGRQNKEVFYRAIRRHLKEDNSWLINRLYQSHYFFSAKPRSMTPSEAALELDIHELQATVPQLRNRNAAEFVDASALGEVEREGFFNWAQ